MFHNLSHTNQQSDKLQKSNQLVKGQIQHINTWGNLETTGKAAYHARHQGHTQSCRRLSSFVKL